jgi:hypothetical protein
MQPAFSPKSHVILVGTFILVIEHSSIKKKAIELK